MMPIKTPKFWYLNPVNLREKNRVDYILTCALKPFSLLYQLGHFAKLSFTRTHKSPIPVICVGNVTTGGSGKTPVCISLNSLIKKYDLFSNPCFLTRGYGGNDPGPRRIKDHDTALTVGDEPLLLASHSNTIVSVNRHYGAKKAHDLGSDLIIMDDGLQNLSLRKDLSFLVIDGTLGLGNRQTLPAGPLREPFTMALKRSDAIIIIGEDTYGIKSLIHTNIPIFKARISPDEQTNPISKDISYIAFAGLGTPEKFFNTLRADGFNLTDTIEFADHHLYSDDDIKRLLEMAASSKSRLITTEKDYVRLPGSFKKQVYKYSITLKWDDESALVHFIAGKIKQ